MNDGFDYESVEWFRHELQDCLEATRKNASWVNLDPDSPAWAKAKLSDPSMSEGEWKYVRQKLRPLVATRQRLRLESALNNDVISRLRLPRRL